MILKLIKKLCPTGKYGVKCPYKMTPEGITVHNTANDATAMNEVNYMLSNNNKVSYHVAVDDTQAVQAIPFNRNAWHAGDGGSGKGNRKTIGIEICYSKSGGSRFDKAEKNAAYLIATLLKKYGWGIGKVKRHKDWSGKNCPHRTIEKGWNRFLEMVQAELDKLNGKKDSTTTASTKTETTNKQEEKKKDTEKLDVDGIWGVDTTTQSQKVMGTIIDGIVSNQPNGNKKHLPAVSSKSWEFKASGYSAGSKMVRAIQKLVGAKEDGFAGTETAYRTQVLLKKLGFYDGEYTKIMDKPTVKAWQEYVNSRL